MAKTRFKRATNLQAIKALTKSQTNKNTNKMNTKEVKITDLEAQQICFALEHEIKSIMRDENNKLDWIDFRVVELISIHNKFLKIWKEN